MNTNVTSHDALVDNYLRAVSQAMAGVPAYRRDELLQDLREHIAAGRAEFGDDETEAQVRSLLDQLGDPAEVADEARIDAPFEPLDRPFDRTAPRPAAPPLQLQPSKRVGAAVWVLIALGLCAMLCVGALLVGLFAFARGTATDGNATPPDSKATPAVSVEAPSPARS
jgi:uncharacterized membrane protein